MVVETSTDSLGHTRVLYRRLTDPRSLPPSPFRLNHALGGAVNVLALTFLAVIWCLQFFPPNPNPTATEMNWGCAIYGFTLVGSIVYYMSVARFRYRGPVVNIRQL